MIDVCDTMVRAERFNKLKVGDRVFYEHNGIKTRQVQKISKTSVIVKEGDCNVRVAWNKIFMA